VTGVALGTTNLFLSIPGLGDYVTTIFVTEPVQPPAGAHQFFAPNLGVFKTPAAAPEEIDRGPFTARLGVVKQSDDPPPTSTLLIAGPHLGIIKGNFLATVDPDAVIADGNPVVLTVTGSGLGNVTDVSIISPDDVSLSGFSADPGGASATLTVTTAAGAALGPRRLVLNTAAGTIPPAAPGADLLHVARGLPEIDSVSPPLLTRNTASANVLLRGRNFLHLEGVTVTPDDGITVGTPQANDDGTEVTFALAVSEDASEGPRVVIVHTVAGESDPAPSAGNTITIVNGPLIPVTPLVGPLLGVVVGPIGLSVEPAGAVIGSSVGLVIRGFELQGVTDVELLPADGITVDGAPLVSPDGTEVRVPITVSPVAETTLRELVLRTSASDSIRFAPATANRLKIVAGLPTIDSIAPVSGTPGSTIALIIEGENLQDVTRIFAEPADGIDFLSTPAPNAGGTELTVIMTIAADAALGERVIRLDSPAGATTDVSAAANTFTVEP
jgi:hypothetical protein